MCSHGYHAFTWVVLMLQQGKLRKEMQSQHPEAKARGCELHSSLGYNIGIGVAGRWLSEDKHLLSSIPNP